MMERGNPSKRWFVIYPLSNDGTSQWFIFSNVLYVKKAGVNVITQGGQAEDFSESYIGFAACMYVMLTYLDMP